ncbi:cell wall anchor protein [Bacillus australimaris]|uniref:Cell wall anchor protein n=2 Tax=Bacillus australimaris TaxID=1326968 RepID=A0ABR5MPU8_9BACI|nr:DUF916 and DUF3324 domain-containing protein [Bacillus australimaris]KPN12694.1 cell wall anchor protein [Bacillus australimaris]
MKSILKIVCMIVFLFTIIDVSQMKQVKASELNFSVTTVIPRNQIDQSKSYFDLKVKPSQKQTLQILLRNDTNRQIVIEPQVHTATTNVNGVVEYGKTEEKKDSTLKYKMENLIKTNKDVTIPAKGKKILSLHLTAPEKRFDGWLAGGITLQEKEKEPKENKKEASLSIENKYSYVVAILLSGNSTKIIPKLQLNKIEPSQLNARNVIQAEIQNVKPMYVNKMSVKAKIMEKGSREVLYQADKKDMQMAPNSHFRFPVPLNGQKLQAGTYTLDMTAQSMNKTWHWTKDFTIDAEIAKELNQKDVTIETDYTWMYVVLGIGLIMIALGILLLFIRKKRKRNIHSDEENQSSFHA